MAYSSAAYENQRGVTRISGDNGDTVAAHARSKHLIISKHKRSVAFKRSGWRVISSLSGISGKQNKAIDNA